MVLTISDFISNTLAQLGIKTVFGVPGGNVSYLLDSFSRHKDINVILAQHEGGAAYMALGRSMITKNNKELSVCIGCAGPGATNLVSGVASAYVERVPIFVITGNVSTQDIGKGGFQDSFSTGVDIVKMFEHITVKSCSITDAENMKEIVVGLYFKALQESRPVHLNIPTNVASQIVNIKEVFHSNRFKYMQNTSYDLELIDKVIKLFIAKEKLVIFCGNGVKLSGAATLLRQISESFALPVISTSHAKGVFYDSHPYYFGSFGFAANNISKDFLCDYKPDAILFLGTGLGEFATNNWSPLLNFPSLKIHVDIDNQQFNKSYSTQYNIETDINIFHDRLNSLLKEHGHTYRNFFDQRALYCKQYNKSSTFWKNQRNQLKESLLNPAPTVNPEHLMTLLSEILPENSSIFLDIGSTMAFAFSFFEVKKGQDLFIVLGLAGMGSGLCSAIGAATAIKSFKSVICIVGDAAALMHGNEFFTAIKEKIPVKFLILNNGGFGMVYHGDKLRNLNCSGINYSDRLDFSKLAVFYNIACYKASSIQDLLNLPLNEIFNADLPIIIDVSINQNVVPPIISRTNQLA